MLKSIVMVSFQICYSLSRWTHSCVLWCCIDLQVQFSGVKVGSFLCHHLVRAGKWASSSFYFVEFHYLDLLFTYLTDDIWSYEKFNIWVHRLPHKRSVLAQIKALKYTCIFALYMLRGFKHCFEVCCLYVSIDCWSKCSVDIDWTQNSRLIIKRLKYMSS